MGLLTRSDTNLHQPAQPHRLASLETSDLETVDYTREGLKLLTIIAVIWVISNRKRRYR